MFTAQSRGPVQYIHTACYIPEMLHPDFTQSIPGPLLEIFIISISVTTFKRKKCFLPFWLIHAKIKVRPKRDQGINAEKTIE